jgi:ribosomal protein S18 acetylase RimI-like enzyme
VAGYVALDYYFFDRGFIQHLIVDPAFRRRGIATALMRAAAERCESAEVFTSTNESNKPMQALLARLGYRHVGVVDHLDASDPEWFFVLSR